MTTETAPSLPLSRVQETMPALTSRLAELMDAMKVYENAIVVDQDLVSLAEQVGKEIEVLASCMRPFF